MLPKNYWSRAMRFLALITSMIGIEKRSTMDIDLTLRNFELSERSIRTVVQEIINIDLLLPDISSKSMFNPIMQFAPRLTAFLDNSSIASLYII